MTELTKPVKRISNGLIRECGQERQIIITLEPPDVLAFRAKGCKRSYRLTANVCYVMAVRAQHEAEQRAKNKKRKSINRGCL